MNNDNVTQITSSSMHMYLHLHLHICTIDIYLLFALSIHTHTTAAFLVIPLSQALEALLAAGAILELALTALRQHALGDYGGADHFIARVHHAIETDKSEY